MELSKDQIKAYDTIMDWYKDPKDYLTLGGYAGTGKSVAIDTYLPSPSGKIKMADIKVGDYVFSKNGKPTKVTGVFPQGVRPTYKITFRDGFSVVCDEDHLWNVANAKNKRKNKWKTVTTKHIIDAGVLRPSGDMRYCIPLCDPVEYQEQSLFIDPYILGLLIGDGSLTDKTSLGITVGNKDVLLREYILNNIKGCSVYEKSGCYFIYIPTKLKYLDYIIKLGLNKKSNEKFIPQNYLNSSINQRRRLLAGLMDSDGCVRGNRTCYSTTSKVLSQHVSELIQSLGGIAIIREYNRFDKNSIEYEINVKTFFNPFKNKYNKNEWKSSTKNPPSRYISSIEKIEDVEMQCISVDSVDQLYLIDHYIVTHNTTLITTLRKDFGKIRVAFCAFTGKAALVLKSKFKEQNYSKDYVGTIHSLIYVPIIDKKTKRIRGWRKQIELDFDLIIIDEASMVDEVLFRDLESFGVPILAVGDHGQLPPIGSQFSLMVDPHIKLEKLHRFAENNALIQVGRLAREEGEIPFKEFSEDIKKVRLAEYRKSAKFIEYLKENNPLKTDSIILCAYNRTRQSLNRWVRKTLEFEKPEPMKGDRVICLRNNNKASPPIYNGQLGVITGISGGIDDMYLIDIRLDGVKYEYYGLIDGRPFIGEDFDTYDRKRRVDFFDFGYCITVHKSQGSQFENIMLVEQECNLWEHNRWLYTGVTRASKQLLILGE